MLLSVGKVQRDGWTGEEANIADPDGQNERKTGAKPGYAVTMNRFSTGTERNGTEYADPAQERSASGRSAEQLFVKQ